MNKTVTQYGISILLISVAAWILLQNDFLALVNRATLLDLIISVAITFVVFALAGIQIGFLSSAQFHVKMKFHDVITLPLMMNFWSFLIPIRGAIVFSILFLKFKYKIKITEGTSISLYMYMISIVLIGFLGFLHAILYSSLWSLQAGISLFLMFCPLIVKGFDALLNQFSFDQSKFLKKTQSVIRSIIFNLNQPWSSIKITGIIFGLTLIRLTARAIWYYWAFYVFDIPIPLMTLIPFTLIMELSKIFRVSPGNLGLEELLSGGVFQLLGGNSAEGILIALFLRVSALILTFGLGTWCVTANMKYFNLDNLKSLWLKLKSE